MMRPFLREKKEKIVVFHVKLHINSHIFTTNFRKRGIFSQFFAKNAFFLAAIFRQHYKKTKIDIIFTNNIKILREIF